MREADSWKEMCVANVGPVFELADDGTFSYLSEEGKTGWRGLGFEAAVNGKLVRAALRSVTKRGAECVAEYEYPGCSLAERVTMRELAAPAALTVERVFRNEGGGPVEITEVRTGLARDRAGVVVDGASPAGLRVAHVSNLRESARRSSHQIGPFLSPLSEYLRTIGDSEGLPFPALAICKGTRRFLLEAALQHDVFTQMWQLRAQYDAKWTHSIFAEYAGVARDGRSQPITLAPGDERRLSSLFYQIKSDCDLQDLYDDYLAELNRRYELRGKNSTLRGTSLYCTWNYTFFADISEAIIGEQCAFIRKRLPGVTHFLIDDGYQLPENTPSYDFGKWYPDADANIDPVRFPNGMRAVSELIRSHGLEPALWWTPAMARINRLVVDHPDWLCLDEEGNSWSMDSGPWRKAALDFSLKEVREFVVSALETIFVKWGFTGMKLDFCIYPFECKDLRFKGGEGVRWWNWFLETIAKFIPRRGIFQLCGSAPYGSPFLGRWCDNHRVGGDIGKGDWATHRSVSKSPLPLFAVPGRATLLMDVDSAGVCHALSDDENLSRINWCFLTQGIMGIGGDLTKLSEKQVGWLDRITRNADRGHKVRCPDRRAYLGEPLPSALYVDFPAGSKTARTGVRKQIGFFNWDDEPTTVGYSLASLGLREGDEVVDFWTGEAVVPEEGQIVARLRRRASRMMEVKSERVSR